MSNAMTSLRNHFLIAMPQLKDPNFEGTISYICDHNEHGAMGIIINRPLEICVGEMLEQLEMNSENMDSPLYGGGPVQPERGFVLHPSPACYQSSMEVGDEISITTSKDILEAISTGEGPEAALIALGYAGWGAGQLEQEISDNMWLTCPASASIVFRTADSQKLSAALGQMGIDYSHLSTFAGHS